MTWREFIEHRASHLEVKFCDSVGETCGRDTVGFLNRHSMRITRLQYVTKEASWLSEAEELVANPAELGGDELGTGRDDIRELALPVLAAHGLNGYKTIGRALGRSETQLRQLQYYLARRDLTNNLSRTLWRNQADPLIKLAVRLACDDMAHDMPADWRDPSALFSPRRLRLAREARMMTRTAVAIAAQVTPAAVSQFERGDARPVPLTLLRLAGALDFP
jgi:DNA-binding XRE family transcriptional regulator